MATGPLSIKLRCASWQQLGTIYKRDLSRGTMFLKASTPPPVGTTVRIDLTLPSATVIVLTGAVDQHVTDPQRGQGVELKLAPLPAGSVWLIESALASESRRKSTPPAAAPAPGSSGTFAAQQSGSFGPVSAATAASASGGFPALGDSEDLVAAEQDLMKALLAEVESLKKLNPFLVLGVGYESSDTDVRAAFGELTKRYHPDLFARYESTQLRTVAAEIFILIRDAYRRLGDEAGRAQALATLGRSAAPRAVPIRGATTPIAPPLKRAQTAPIAPVVTVPKAPEAIPPRSAPSEPRPTSEPARAAGEPPRPTTDHAVTIRPGEAPPIAPAAITVRPGEAPPIPPSAVTPLPRIPASAAVAVPAFVRPVEAERPRSGPITTAPVSAPSPARAPSPALKRPSDPPPLDAERKPALAAPPPTEGGDASALEELLDAGKIDEALAAYKVLAKKHPSDRTARAGIELCEGMRAMAQRDRLEAAQRFETALEIDPSSERAARELAEMRRQATNERKGLLTRLMGKDNK